MAQGFTLILSVSMIIWYIVDRFKTEFWEGTKYGRYITMALAAALSFSTVFSFNLDIFYAADIVEISSIMGNILTGLLLMSGSSAISYVIERIAQPASMTNILFKEDYEEEEIID